MRVMFGVGVICMVIGGAAYFIGQDYAVFYPPLLLLGLILIPVMGISLRQVKSRNEQLELRKMSAQIR